MSKKFLKGSATAYRGRDGVTLIEVVLSLALIVLIFGIATPIYQDYQIRNGVDISVNTIVENLRRAQILSEAVDGDSTWGVNITSGNITLFKGASFVARDSSFDESSDMLSSILPSGLTEIVFSKLDGFPNNVGILTLTANGTSRTISINEKGTVIF